MLTKYPKLNLLMVLLIFMSCYPLVHADTTPIVGTCSSLGTTDLSTDMANEIDSRIAGVTASDVTKMLWTTRGDDKGGWARSSTVWTNNGTTPLNFTGASPWNSLGGYKWGGTLISPRHFLMANHTQIPIGDTIVFVNSSNTVFSYTIVNEAQVGSSDIRVAELDRDVDSSIAYYLS